MTKQSLSNSLLNIEIATLALHQEVQGFARNDCQKNSYENVDKIE
jgi:hypothetical protein